MTNYETSDDQENQGGYGKGDMGSVDPVAARLLDEGDTEGWRDHVRSTGPEPVASFPNPAVQLAIEHPEVSDPYGAVEDE